METKKKAAPNIKKSNDTIVREAIQKDGKLVKVQCITFGMKGVKELPLTYKVKEGHIEKKLVRHGDVLELPYGYIRYLNTHNKIKKGKAKTMVLEDSEGNPKQFLEEEEEQRYLFRVLDPLPPEELSDLEAIKISKVKSM